MEASTCILSPPVVLHSSTSTAVADLGAADVDGDGTTADVEGDGTTADVEGDGTTAHVDGDGTTADVDDGDAVALPVIRQSKIIDIIYQQE